MSKKIHMRDQVGARKVDEFMNHYNRWAMDMWTMKFMLVGMFLFLGLSW
ncbi:MAG: hypothetical protein ABL919_09580 [Methylococcales bacterium]|nr:hypothetical protein [Methylococcaceae bacterium]